MLGAGATPTLMDADEVTGGAGATDSWLLATDYSPSDTPVASRRGPESAEETDEVEELGRVEGLFEDGRGMKIVVGLAQLVARDDQNRTVFSLLPVPPEPLPAIHVRHHDIENEEHDVRIFVDEIDGFVAIGCREDVETVRGQKVAIRREQPRITVDDEELPEADLGFPRAHDQYYYTFFRDLPAVSID